MTALVQILSPECCCFVNVAKQIGQPIIAMNEFDGLAERSFETAAMETSRM